MQIGEILKNFKNPPNGYRPIPFWFWNAELQNTELERQIHEIYEKGLGGAVIHARFGLDVSYLSDSWFTKVNYCLELFQRFGLEAWIYDEENWPSGTAGGKVLGIDEDFCAKCLQFCFIDPATNNVTPPDDCCSLVDVYAIRCISGIYKPDTYAGGTDQIRISGSRGVFEATSIKRLGQQVHNGILAWDKPGEDWYCFAIWQKKAVWNPAYSNSLYIDCLDSRATAHFIELTHNQYHKHCGQYFGNTLKGFFTDEPGMYVNLMGRTIGCIPITRGLFQVFEKQKKYDLRNFLPMLWLESGECSRKIRHDFWDFISGLYQNSFFKPIYDWCEAHGVESIGHIVLEEDLLYHIRTQGHYFRSQEYLHRPGVDRIARQRTELNDKLGSSAAHIQNKHRSLNECFGVFGWDLTLADMKFWNDSQLVLGTNMIVPHAFFYSIEGDRKNECPPSLFFQNTFWEYFKLYAEYIGRVSYLLSRGSHVADIAVYYPIETAWEKYCPDETSYIEHLNYVVSSLERKLLNSQYDFDYIDGDSLAKYAVVQQHGHLKVHNENYKIIILPNVLSIPEKVLALLERFINAGGILVCIETLPECLKKYHEMDKLVFIKEGVSELLTYLSKHLDSDVLVSSSNEKIRYLHRRIGEYEIYFVVSQSASDLNLTMKFRSVGNCYKLDTRICELQEMATISLENYTQLEMSFSSYESQIVLFAKQPILGAKPYLKLQKKTFLTLNNRWDILLSDGRKFHANLQDLCRLGAAYYSGRIEYLRRFAIEKISPNTRIILNLGSVMFNVSVKVNGSHVGSRAWAPFDFDITDALLLGENRLTIDVSNTPANKFNRKEYPSGLLGPVVLEQILLE